MAKRKVQKDKQRFTKHTHKAKNRVTRNPLKTGDFCVCIYYNYEIFNLTMLKINYCLFSAWSWLDQSSWLVTWFVTRLTRRVPLVEQELLTFPEDDEVRFVLDQQAELDFYSASSLNQQSKRRVWRYQRGNQNPYIEEDNATVIPFTLHATSRSHIAVDILLDFSWTGSHQQFENRLIFNEMMMRSALF
jgi:hypothetical protein